MKEYDDKVQAEYIAEREKAPDSTVYIDNWKGDGNEWEPYMAGRQHDQRKYREYYDKKLKWKTDFKKHEKETGKKLDMYFDPIVENEILQSQDKHWELNQDLHEHDENEDSSSEENWEGESQQEESQE